MGKSTQSTHDFWASNPVNALIGQRISFDGLSAEAQKTPWHSLQQFLVRASWNDDHRAELTGLFLFATLAKKCAADLEARHGVDSWERVRKEWQDDDRRSVFLKFFRQLTLAKHWDAAASLRKLKYDGISYQLPGGWGQRVTPIDFGIETLVTLTHEIDALLAEKQDRQRHSAVTPISFGTDKRRVVIRPLGPKIIELKLGSKTCRLGGKDCYLILILKQQQTTLTFARLWHNLHTEIEDEPSFTTAPSDLRSVKYHAENELRKEFGRPPDGTSWIKREDRVGYRLNDTGLEWRYAPDSEDRLRAYLKSSRSLDGQIDEDA